MGPSFAKGPRGCLSVSLEKRFPPYWFVEGGGASHVLEDVLDGLPDLQDCPTQAAANLGNAGILHPRKAGHV